MSSQELETGLETLSLDLALGYIERMHLRDVKLEAWPQSIEHYFLLRRAARRRPIRCGSASRSARPKRRCSRCVLLTPDMHNRSIVDQAFRSAGATVTPAIETNSVLTLVLGVVAGEVCSVLPGAMVAAVRSQRELEALPLVAPEVTTPIGFMTQQGVRPSRALEAALALLRTPQWQAQVEMHSGALAA